MQHLSTTNSSQGQGMDYSRACGTSRTQQHAYLIRSFTNAKGYFLLTRKGPTDGHCGRGFLTCGLVLTLLSVNTIFTR